MCMATHSTTGVGLVDLQKIHNLANAPRRHNPVREVGVDLAGEECTESNNTAQASSDAKTRGAPCQV